MSSCALDGNGLTANSGGQNEKTRCNCNGFFCVLVPRRGLEPPRLAALVPETSASTNSAIWAGTRIIANAFTIAKAFLHRVAQPAHVVPVRSSFAPAGAPTGDCLAALAGRPVGAAAAANGQSSPRQPHSCAQAQFAPAGAPTRKRLAGRAGRPVGAAAAANRPSNARQAIHPRGRGAKTKKSRSEERLSCETGAQKRTRTSTPRGAST